MLQFSSNKILTAIYSFYQSRKNRIAKIVIFLLVLLITFSVHGQKAATFRNIDFQLAGDSLIIIYEIGNYKVSDRFNVRPEIFTISGVKLEAKSLSGDLSNITGGPGKKITWDITKDNIMLDDDIYVVLSGVRVEEPDAAKPKHPEPVQQEANNLEKMKIHPVNRTACFFESLVFPGWGTSRLTLNKVHFIKGVLGYGSVILSLVYNNMANEKYSLYKEAQNSTARDDFYSEMQKYQLNSQIFAYGAAAIWSIDLITVLAVKNKTLTNFSSSAKISLGYTLAAANTHQLVIRLNF